MEQKEKNAKAENLIKEAMSLLNQAMALLTAPFYAIENKTMSDEQIFKAVSKEYGKEYARELEQVMRLEMAHFKSTLYDKHNGNAMVAQSDKFPYGWSSLKSWCEKTGVNPATIKTVTYEKSSDGTKKTYVSFPSKYLAIMFFAYFIKNVRGGNFSAWVGLDANLQAKYKAAYSKISPKFN